MVCRVCVCVCVCLFVRSCSATYTPARVHALRMDWMYVCVYMCTCVGVYMYVCAYVNVYVCVYVCVCMVPKAQKQSSLANAVMFLYLVQQICHRFVLTLHTHMPRSRTRTRTHAHKPTHTNAHA